MILFYCIFILIFTPQSFVLSDITSPVNYQPIKYSHIHLEVNYPTNNGLLKKEFDFTHQNILVTVINSKNAVQVSGRLLVVKNDDPNKINGTIASRMSNINGACTTITTASDTQWIALVLKGGHCSIKEKLDNILLHTNASAVIILDNSLPRNADRFEFHNSVGLLLSELSVPMHLLLNESIFINATIIVNNFFVDGFISRTSVLFVSISFILLMVISLVWLIFYYIQRFRYMHAKERLSRRLANAAKKALDKIPLKILSAHDNEVSNDYDQCAICIDNYNAGETIRILPCKHIFHKVCIDSWLIEQRSCPMCKVDILKACGVLNVCDTGKSRDRVVSSLLNQGLWVSSATVTATAALLEAGLNGDSLAIDSIGSNPNSRCRRGHSTFLQRYRERYGLYHCRHGHRRDHFQKISRHFHEHRCFINTDKLTSTNVTLHPAQESYNINQLEPERVDLISESDNSIISQKETCLNISIPEENSSKCSPRLNCKQQELQEINNGLVYDICECSSNNTNGDCDVCDRNQNNSASTICSCETCSDCPFTDVDCGHCDTHRNNHVQSSGLGNLLKCCMTSNTTINTVNNNNNSIAGLYCCTRQTCKQCQSSTCSSCNNKTTTIGKNCSSNCGQTKMGNCHYPTNLKTSQFSQMNKPIVPMRQTSQIRLCDADHFDNVKRLKSVMLMKNANKGGTIDSYTKSSISDDFDYEADNGSSSIELSIPAVKLTVLPPQVQCHQGPINSECGLLSEPVTIFDVHNTIVDDNQD